MVNNVGFARFGRIGSIELDHLFDTYDLNVRTAVQVVQAALPGMLAAGWGRIVNVTSLTTLGTPERTPYAASKAALEACTRIWANELASTGITVNAVAPGPIETEMYRERSPIGSEREARLLEKHSAGPGRHTAGDRACDLRAARRGRRLHHGSDHPGRRRRKHRRMSTGGDPPSADWAIRRRCGPCGSTMWSPPTWWTACSRCGLRCSSPRFRATTGRRGPNCSPQTATMLDERRRPADRA